MLKTKLILLWQCRNSLRWHGLLSSDFTAKLFQWAHQSVEIILNTERRQEDCLLAAAGWIREKSLECWESTAFQARRRRRKETRAWKLLPTCTGGVQLVENGFLIQCRWLKSPLAVHQTQSKWLNICTVRPNSNKTNELNTVSKNNNCHLILT